MEKVSLKELLDGRITWKLDRYEMKLEMAERLSTQRDWTKGLEGRRSSLAGSVMKIIGK